MRSQQLFRIACGLFLVLIASAPALAHPGHVGHEFVDGWQHPLTGVDHLLAMVAVGLLAVRIGGKALWLMPATFMASMLLGGLAAELGLPLPGAEYAIAASVLILGMLIAATSIVPLPIGVGLVALFAMCHGHAHATEMVQGGSMAAYAAGFLLATAVLHTTGVAGGIAISRFLSPRALQTVGGMISATGLLLLFAVI